MIFVHADGEIYFRNSFADFSQGMPKLDGNNEDLTRESTSKTLLEQYSTSFHSSRSIASKNRRTILDISMDIIRQRMDNINKIASMNRSIREPDNQKDNDETRDEVPPILVADGDKPKPLKRKLFAPPSLFSPVLDIPQENKSSKKRGRDDLKSESKNRKSIDKRSKFVAGGDGTPNQASRETAKSRRSTMLFQSTEKPKVKEESAAKCNNNTETPKSVMVFTNMHQEQIEVIKEVR